MSDYFDQKQPIISLQCIVKQVISRNFTVTRKKNCEEAFSVFSACTKCVEFMEYLEKKVIPQLLNFTFHFL